VASGLERVTTVISRSEKRGDAGVRNADVSCLSAYTRYTFFSSVGDKLPEEVVNFPFLQMSEQGLEAPVWKMYFNQMEIWRSVQNYCQNKSSGTHCTQNQVIKDQTVFYEPQNLLIPVCFFLVIS